MLMTDEQIIIQTFLAGKENKESEAFSTGSVLDPDLH
jgi:hypothetical protein